MARNQKNRTKARIRFLQAAANSCAIRAKAWELKVQSLWDSFFTLFRALGDGFVTSLMLSYSRAEA